MVNLTGVAYCRRYVVPGNEMINPDHCKRDEIITEAQKATQLGLHELERNGLCYIEHVQLLWWNATHPSSRADDSTKKKASKDYDELAAIVNSLLKTELKRDQEGRATLFGGPIARAGLSEGQLALLLWGVGLHAQGVQLGDAILIMDEPENHLHADSAIQVVCRSIEANEDGQVWIATHSVPLIAALTAKYPDDVSLLFVNEGKVSFAGRDPERILLSLIGGDDNLMAMREFIDLPEQLAVNRFAAQCLCPPSICASNDPEDPQMRLADNGILGNAPTGQVSKVLDFGAGHGRLLESLFELHGDALKERLEYVAWDHSDSCVKQCLAAVNRVYGKEIQRRFTDSASLFGTHPAGYV